MKNFLLSLFILASVQIVADSILIKGGMVHTGTGERAQLQDILITGKVITDIGNNLVIDGNTQVIEVNGLPVTPGLISPMSNIGIVEINALGRKQEMMNLSY